MALFVNRVSSAANFKVIILVVLSITFNHNVIHNVIINVPIVTIPILDFSLLNPKTQRTTNQYPTS